MIKDWEKLTDEELYNLSYDEIDFYKKLLYAQNGIKFPEKPKEIDSINIAPDKTIYKVSFLENIYFEDVNEAIAIIDTLLKCKTLGHIEQKDYKDTYFDLGTPLNYWKNHEPIEVSTKNCYSKEKYKESEETLLIYNKLCKQYEKDKEEYDKTFRKASEITEDFINKLEDAKKAIYRRKELTYKYWRDYLKLAENNHNIAMDFMKKAYVISEDDELYIKTHKDEVIDND